MSDVTGEGSSTERSTTDQAREKTQQVTGQAREKAQEVTGQAREKAQEKAQEVRGQARGRMREQVDQRSTQAGEQVTSVSQAVRRTGEQLRSEGQEGPAKLADQAAERADRLGRYLTESDGDRILGDIEGFARRQPWAVAAIGGVLGFVAARFLKASSGRRYQSQQDGRGLPPASYRSPAALQTEVAPLDAEMPLVAEPVPDVPIEPGVTRGGTP